MRYKLGIGIILFYLAIQIYLVLEDRRQRYFGHCSISKKTYIIFIGIGYQ